MTQNNQNLRRIVLTRSDLYSLEKKFEGNVLEFSRAVRNCLVRINLHGENLITRIVDLFKEIRFQRVQFGKRCWLQLLGYFEFHHILDSLPSAEELQNIFYDTNTPHCIPLPSEEEIAKKWEHLGEIFGREWQMLRMPAEEPAKINNSVKNVSFANVEIEEGELIEENGEDKTGKSVFGNGEIEEEAKTPRNLSMVIGDGEVKRGESRAQQQSQNFNSVNGDIKGKFSSTSKRKKTTKNGRRHPDEKQKSLKKKKSNPNEEEEKKASEIPKCAGNDKLNGIEEKAKNSNGENVAVEVAFELGDGSSSSLVVEETASDLRDPNCYALLNDSASGLVGANEEIDVDVVGLDSDVEATVRDGDEHEFEGKDNTYQNVSKLKSFVVAVSNELIKINSKSLAVAKSPEKRRNVKTTNVISTTLCARKSLRKEKPERKQQARACKFRNNTF